MVWTEQNCYGMTIQLHWYHNDFQVKNLAAQIVCKDH